MNDSYFQFPLCLLAMGDDEKERLEKIISSSTVEKGFVLLAKVAPELKNTLADDLRSYKYTPADYKANNREHVAAVYGAKQLGVTLHSVRGALERWTQACDFRNKFQSLHGRDVELRIKRDLAFEVMDKAGMSYREFSIYCAVLSRIGDKRFLRITREQIQMRMLGYRKKEIMQTELSKRTDGQTPLSVRQIGYTVDKLHERGCFARVRPNERQTFYSVRLTQDDLEAALLKSKTYAQKFHAERRKRNTGFMEKMKAAKAAIKADMAIKVNTSPCSNDVRSASASASATVSTGLSTLIETPCIETTLTQTLLTQTAGERAHATSGEKILALDVKPEIGKPEMKPPTLEDVLKAAESISSPSMPVTRITAERWFNQFGTDARWIKESWRNAFAKWTLQKP